MHLCYVSLLEIRHRKNLAKLKGAAGRINGNKPEGKNTMKEKNIDKNQKKDRKVALPGFEPAPQLPPALKLKPHTKEPCDKFTFQFLKLIV